MSVRKKVSAAAKRVGNSVADFTKASALVKGARNVKQQMTFAKHPGIEAAVKAKKAKGMVTYNEATGKVLGKAAKRAGTSIMDLQSSIVREYTGGIAPKGAKVAEEMPVAKTAAVRAVKRLNVPAAAEKVVGKAAVNYAKKFTAKAVAGRVLGRAVPAVGTALLAKDAYDVGKAIVKRAKSGADSDNEKQKRKAASKNSGGGRKIGGRR